MPGKSAWDGPTIAEFPMPRIRHTLALLIVALVLCGAAARRCAAATEGIIVWKQSQASLLKLNGRAVKTWNVYGAEKKNNLILVHLGRRYLALDTKAREVYEFHFESLTPKGEGFESGPLESAWRQIPTTGWYMRDVGPAELIRVKLMDYGCTLEVQTPHLYDFRVSH